MSRRGPPRRRLRRARSHARRACPAATATRRLPTRSPASAHALRQPSSSAAERSWCGVPLRSPGREVGVDDQRQRADAAEVVDDRRDGVVGDVGEVVLALLSSTCRAMIDLVPRPSTTKAKACSPSSNTNAGSPRDSSSARPPLPASSGEVDKRLGHRQALAGVERVVVHAGRAVGGTSPGSSSDDPKPIAATEENRWTFSRASAVTELKERLGAFMDEHVYPAEEVYERQIAESGDPHHHPPVMEELKSQGARGGAVEHVPSRRRVRRGALQQRLCAACRDPRPLGRSPPRRATARPRTPATWRCCTCSRPPSSASAG